MDIRLKRAYTAATDADGTRVLVDRLWPRGVSKEKARLDLWLKAIAPSTELRKWFNHDPAKWEEFCQRYTQELEDNPEAVKRLLELADTGRITLIYGARDEAHNEAVMLKEYLEAGRR
ncbi:MAG: DUF488 domain-containing protein [Caldilinea sp.]|uniref:DUF488 domain-containing protein n=1 Tax=Caldilinea sp. TaxID=2293560 RepID=UPI002C06FAD6|nr:DUF488 domain-containing protein [Anaerolineales bacterium]HQY95031.1 DUF488 domain-containing protein [Caldilinea sp.]HRA68621.1 DUF488 domain-containing protein [Caldilinea sp.]